MSKAHEQVIYNFFDAVAEQSAHEAANVFAADGRMFEQVGLRGLQGRVHIEAFLNHVFPQLGGWRYDMLTIASVGDKVLFERVERSTLTERGARPGYPAGTPLAMHIAGVATIDAERGEILEWYDFWTIPTLQKHSAIPEGVPSIPWVPR